MINLKQKLKNNIQTIGSWITIPNSIMVEIMCQHFDWLVVDMEHSAIDLNQVQNLVRLIESKDCVPLVRVSENNPNLIKRVLDTGTKGIIVPMINSKEDAVNALSSVHYPPEGNRGVGLARAQEYGFGFDKYQKILKNDVVVIAQIEHVAAIKHLDDILRTNIDGIIIGPYDISASMGHPGAFCRTDYKQKIEFILGVTELHHKPAGIHIIQPYDSEFKNLDKRYKFIAFSLDTLFFGSKIRDELKCMKKYQNIK